MLTVLILIDEVYLKMIDKKTENSINLLIKKLKDENLGSLKFSNKTVSIEISNNSGSVQIAQSPVSSELKTFLIPKTMSLQVCKVLIAQW